MSKERVVVIVSGGVDSTTLLYDLDNSEKYDIYVLSFDYKQKHRKELEYAKWNCAYLKIPHKILDLSLLNEVAPSSLTREDWEIPEGHYESESMKQTVVPNRNMVMLSIAVAYAIGIGAKKVFYGAHGGDHAIYPDCRSEFVERMREVIEICDWSEVKLEAPYLHLKKEEIVKRGLKLDVPYAMTWSCYKGGEKACGKCGTCIERLEAFRKNKAEDPIKYENTEEVK
jgi:7-cyano-7-deazaguanine synthase